MSRNTTERWNLKIQANRDVIQHEIPTAFRLFSMQEHTYWWLTVKMPYIRLPKYLVHFRWRKDTVKIVVVKTVSSCLHCFIEFFGGLFFLHVFLFLFVVRPYITFMAICPPLLKYANNTLYGIVKRNYAGLLHFWFNARGLPYSGNTNFRLK